MVSFLGNQIMAATQILIVDDVQQVCDDLRILLTLAGDIEVVGVATNGLDGVLQADIIPLPDLQFVAYLLEGLHPLHLLFRRLSSNGPTREPSSIRISRGIPLHDRHYATHYYFFFFPRFLGLLQMANSRASR